MREKLKPGKPYMPSVKNRDLPIIHPFAEVWLNEAMKNVGPQCEFSCTLSLLGLIAFASLPCG